MTIFVWFLSVIMFLNSILLILLVLVQQPKKDSGAGMAFGGSTADALFGAGSGNALTTITKYSAGIFFAIALLMAVITSHRGKTEGSLMEKALTGSGGVPAQSAATPSNSSPQDILNLAPVGGSNSAATAGTNAAAKPAAAPEKAAPAVMAPAAKSSTNK